jgi:phosphatidylglycerophosphatase A
MTRLAVAISTFFGCGYFPKGPGTAGSLAGLAIVVVLHRFFGLDRIGLLCLTAAVTPIGIWSATRTARSLKRKDPGLVVIDEVLGQWVTLLGAAAWDWKTYLAGFVLFRLFDIWKPQPVRLAESLPEGIGIVADDLMAGIYGALILYIGAQLRLY